MSDIRHKDGTLFKVNGCRCRIRLAVVALNLEMMIIDLVQAHFLIEASVAGTKKVLDKDIDFAFLDIDVTNGKTFGA